MFFMRGHASLILAVSHTCWCHEDQRGTGWTNPNTCQGSNTTPVRSSRQQTQLEARGGMSDIPNDLPGIVVTCHRVLGDDAVGGSLGDGLPLEVAGGTAEEGREGSGRCTGNYRLVERILNEIRSVTMGLQSYNKQFPLLDWKFKTATDYLALKVTVFDNLSTKI